MDTDGVINVFQILLSTFSCFNFVCYIFIVICIIRHPSLQTITNYFLFSTGVAHIFSQFMCLILIFKMHDLCSLYSPLAFLAFLFIGMFSVFGNTLLVTTETYLKVCHPFRYAQMITERICFLLIALIWIISFGLGIAAVTGFNDKGNGTGCTFEHVISLHGKRLSNTMNVVLVPSLVIITVLKMLVIRTARIQSDRIEPYGGKEPPQQQQEQQQQQQQQQQKPNGDIGEQLQQKFKNIRKSTINLAIFVGTYVCGWIPVLIMANVCLHSQCSGVSPTGLIITFLVVTNLTSLGPLVYTLRQPEFSRLRKTYQQQLKAYLCGLRGGITKKVHVNFIRSQPTVNTEIVESVSQ